MHQAELPGPVQPATSQPPQTVVVGDAPGFGECPTLSPCGCGCDEVRPHARPVAAKSSDLGRALRHAVRLLQLSTTSVCGTGRSVVSGNVRKEQQVLPVPHTRMCGTGHLYRRTRRQRTIPTRGVGMPGLCANQRRGPGSLSREVAGCSLVPPDDDRVEATRRDRQAKGRLAPQTCERF